MKSIWLPCLLLTLALAGPSAAAIIVVNTLDDEQNTDGDCSLREGIVGSNTDTKVDACTKGLGADLIWITAIGTIQTPAFAGLPTITDRVEILGHDQLTIDGRGSGQIFTVDLANAAHDFTLTGNGTVLRRGRAVGRGGGAIYLINADQVVVKDVVFEDNRACDVLVSGLFCGSDPQIPLGAGGAIGIASSAGAGVAELRIEGSWFLRNRATGSGGAVATTGPVTTTIERSWFVGNESAATGGGAFLSSGPLTIDRSAFAANRGKRSGGLQIHGANGNIYPLAMVNTLIVDNEATWSDSAVGGISITHRDADISFTTIARNRSAVANQIAGLWIAASTTRITHTAITDNLTGPDCAYYPGSEPLANSSNLDSDGTCGLDPDEDDLPSGSAMMSGLGSFVGQPIVALPSAHSPLIDAGDNRSCFDTNGNFVTVDLLGNPRPDEGDGESGRCDVGAIEVQPPHDFLFGDGFEAGTTTAWN